MGRRADAGGAVHGHADVVAVDDLGLACVQAHAHSDLAVVGPAVVGEGELGGHRARHSRRRLLEDDEQGVAPRAHFLAAVAAEGGPHELVVSGEEGGIAVAEALEEMRRPLQVREEEGERPPRQPPIRHGARLMTGCDTVRPIGRQ